MAILRAVVTLPYTSGLPEDVVVNTFHFQTTSTPSTAGERTALQACLEQFYNGDNSGAGSSLSANLALIVSRAALAASTEFFDLADAEPRQPVGSFTWTVEASNHPSSAPPEVALCLSYQALPISGVPQARRRGRVYCGPFNLTHLAGDGRPTAALLEVLREAGEGLKGQAATAGCPWGVYSRVGSAIAVVANGWVDNEWDTMRSRGRKATTRGVF